MSEKKAAEIIRPGFSSVFLPSASPVLRKPRAPGRQRPSSFLKHFEDRALFYDCFRHHQTTDILLVGPPPLNLSRQFEQAEFKAIPSGKALKVNFFPSRSSMTTALSGAADDTTGIVMNFAGMDYEIEVQENLVDQLAGSRILFTMNKDNEPAWIADWARHHVFYHQSDTIILFDNGSTSYDVDDLEARLGKIDGLKKLVLINWPHKYGRLDTKVVLHRHWAHFSQISSMNIVLRRMAIKAEAILNCDIDELIAPLKGSNVYQLASGAPHGIATLSGSWVENIVHSEGSSNAPLRQYRHADFIYQRRDPGKLLCPKKWALDPKRSWVEQLDVFPYMHRIMGAPERKVTEKPRGRFFHFKGINTSWKNRSEPPKVPGLSHKRVPELAGMFAKK